MNGDGGLEDSNTQSWAWQTCRVMIMRQGDIEDKLRTEQCLEAFLDHMARWREEHLDKSPFQPGLAATALYGICQDFGLLIWLEEHSHGAHLRVRGHLTTRGASLPGKGSLENLLKEVARLFGRKQGIDSVRDG